MRRDTYVDPEEVRAMANILRRMEAAGEEVARNVASDSQLLEAVAVTSPVSGVELRENETGSYDVVDRSGRIVAPDIRLLSTARAITQLLRSGVPPLHPMVREVVVLEDICLRAATNLKILMAQRDRMPNGKRREIVETKIEEEKSRIRKAQVRLEEIASSGFASYSRV